MAGTDPVSQLFANAPELVNTPGLAADSLTAGGQIPGGVGQAGQVMSLMNTAATVDDHVQKHQGFFSRWTPGFIKQAGGFALKAAAAPLNEVQHDYRFLHDVFERQGVPAGLLALGVTAAGTAGGAMLGGPQGALIGGEAATSLFARGMTAVDPNGKYGQSWKVTAEGANYRDAEGRLVSPGRDLANVVDHVLLGHGFTGKGFIDNAVSGTGDAVFDLTLDPLMIASKVGQARKLDRLSPIRQGEKGLADVKSLHQVDAAGEFVRDDLGAPILRRPGIHDTDVPADRIVEIYNSDARVRQMVGVLKDASTEDILNRMPKLAPLAKELGAAKTEDDVLNVYRDALTTKNYSALSGGLPRTGLTRFPVKSTVGAAVKNAGSRVATDAAGNPLVSGVTGDVLEKPNAFIRTMSVTRAFNISDDLKHLSGKTFDLADDSAAKTLKDILRISQNDRTANAITATFLHSTDLAEKHNIFINAVTDMARVAGVPESSEFLTRLRQDLQQLTDTATYGVGPDGKNIVHTFEDGQEGAVALLANQTGKVAIPSFEDVRRAAEKNGGMFAHAYNKANDVYGRFDDWVYKHYTTRWFKRFALLTLGFATRVASGELVPATIKYGSDVMRGGLATAAVRMNPGLEALAHELGPEEAGRLAGVKVRVPDMEGEPSRIVSVNANDATATVRHADGAEGVYPLHELDAYHEEIPEKELRLIARQAGINLDRDEVGHVKAAVSKALYGVSRAIVDKDYAHMAYLNILSNDGHMLPASMTADHGSSRVFSGQNHEVVHGLHQINLTAPDDMRLSNRFGLFGGSEKYHPMYWSHAIHEAAADPGLRKAAAMYDTVLSNGGTRAEAQAAFLKADKGVVAVNPRVYKERLVGAADDPTQFSRNRLELFEGLVYGPSKGKFLKPDREFDNGPDWIEMHRGVADFSGKHEITGEHFRTAEELHRYMADNGHEHFGHWWSDSRRIADQYGLEAENGVVISAKFHKDDLRKHPYNEGHVTVPGAQGHVTKVRVGSGDENGDAIGKELPFTEGLKVRASERPVVDERAYHDFVTKAIASGDAPSLRALDAVDNYDRPTVKGRVWEPIPQEATIDKVAQLGFRKVLQPFINYMSREPLFTTIVTDEYKALKPFVEHGLMTPAEANLVAQQRAVPKMLPLIHNTELRSQFSVMTRNYMPFYYAQEQAYKRYANAIFSSPQAFERYRLAVHAIHSSGIIQNDGEGNSYIVFPHMGKLSEWMTSGAGALGLPVLGGIPSQVSGNISSLKSVVPGGLVGTTELPGVSPLMAIGLKEIQAAFPKTEPFISEAIGPIAESQGVSDAMIPNSILRNAIKATPAGERSRSFQSAYMYAIANAKRRSDELRAEGKDAEADAILPGPEANELVKQKALDRIRNATRIMFLTKTLFSAVSPLAPKIDAGDFGLRDEFRSYIDKYGIVEGAQRFLDKNPDATADTVFQSDNTYTGTDVPAGEKALEWVQANRGFISKHNLAAAYLVPQSGTFDSQAYNLELATGLRQHKTPTEFLAALYSASANADYFPALKARDAAIAQYPGMKQEINRQFTEYKMRLAANNPVWYAQLNDPVKQQVAFQALGELRSTLESGTAPESPQAAVIRGLISDYDNFAYQQNQLSAAGESTRELTQQWSSYLDRVAASNPAATAVINGVFRKLPAYERYSLL